MYEIYKKEGNEWVLIGKVLDMSTAEMALELFSKDYNPNELKIVGPTDKK